MKPAFSTVACPEWSLLAVAQAAQRWGYMGVELRTFADAGSQFACEPALTSPAKARSMFQKAGVEITALATSIRCDQPVTLIERILGDREQAVREAKSAIDLAIAMEVPLVRVYGFELHEGLAKADVLAVIADRLGKAVDYARNSGVRVMLETGGSFARAADAAEIIDRVAEPGLAACYNAAAGLAAGEPAVNGVNILGERLASVRVTDLRAGVACGLGEGEVDNPSVFAALASFGYKGWIVYDYPRAWTAGLGDVEGVLAGAARTMYRWIGTAPRAGGAAPSQARRQATNA